MQVKILLAILLGLSLSACSSITQFLQIGSGHKAKVLCSDLFISKRDASSILNAGISEWQTLGDPRGTIAPENLLHMSSELEFSEGGPLADMSILLINYKHV